MLFLLFGTSSVPNAKLLVIAQSLLSPRVKKMKIGQYLPKLLAIKYVVVFL